jgi:hypothetical protein
MKESVADSSNDSRWWTALWHLNVPPKVRIFWWRALNSFVPTKRELKRRHIEHEDHCNVCGVPGETLYHVALPVPLRASSGECCRRSQVLNYPHYPQQHGHVMCYQVMCVHRVRQR